MAEDRIYIPYKFDSPRMDRSVPTDKVKPGTFGRLVGVDGRFNGGLHKFYGMREVLDLDDVSGMGDIDTYDGPSYFKAVTFQKRNTSTIYKGFVVRWDSQDDNADEQVDLVYTGDNGSTWARHAIWAAGNSIASTLEMDCTVDRGYLLVAVDGKSTKTVYWNGAALATVDSGPGDFDSTLTAPTKNTSAVDTSYYLSGNGRYQVAYRFYDSTRGIYSSLSNPLTVTLDHQKTTKATATITFNSGGDDSGLMVAGDVFTINSRTYEYIDAGSDVTVAAAAGATIPQHVTALADAINGDSSATVTASPQATSILLTAIARGSGGNAYGLSTTGGNDFSVSAATFTGGGNTTGEAETQVKLTIDFPANTAVLAGEAYADFDALFDTVDIFRTINLGDTPSTQGAIFYLEQTIAKAGNWATSGAWDSLTADIGTVVDDALPFLTMYDPQKDIVASPPQSGTIGRYGDLTYMAQDASVDGGYDTLHSSMEHGSPEYFSTYNKREGDPEDGRPLRFISAGDSMFQLCYNAIIHIFRQGRDRPLQYTRLHAKRGVVGKEAAHSSGNSIFMISGLGMAVLNATDGSMGGVSAADRVIFDEWKSDLSGVKSCYDALMNCSFFLNPTQREILCLWHSTRTLTFIEGANFVGASAGPDITNGRNNRAFFITATGLIVSPDTAEAGSGSMWDLSSTYTLDGTATTGGTTLTDSDATLNADMVGARLYMTSGANVGYDREIATIDNTTKVITFTDNFPAGDIAVGDRYSISPVPFAVRAWSLQGEDVSEFNRWIMVGAALRVGGLSGFDSNPNAFWRVSAYRDQETTPEEQGVYIGVDYRTGISAGHLNIDGVEVTPYIEQISVGTKLELTDAEFNVAQTDSRKTGDEYGFGEGRYGSGRYGY
jgi:hypothetical protein